MLEISGPACKPMNLLNLELSKEREVSGVQTRFLGRERVAATVHEKLRLCRPVETLIEDCRLDIR